ncbi:MAG: hypothetical protein O3B01_29985 [Planctomycetota bacterium]|nr:hypothetical protein [Planctomycetota bacterium]
MNQFITMDRGHLMHILKQVEAHHISERPHQGLKNEVPIPIAAPSSPATGDQILCTSRLGGLFTHYSAKAGVNSDVAPMQRQQTGPTF